MDTFRLKVGLIGAGRMGQLYARIINESRMAQIVALVGNTPEKTEAVAQKFNVVGYPNGDYASLWQHDLDAVIIATPEWDHLTPTLQAFEHDCHVLLEKPMTHTLPEAQKIYEASQANDKIGMLCHVLRFDPRFAILQQKVQAGDLGDIKHIYARRSADQATFQRIAGRCHAAYWLSPHDVDLMRWITGAEVTQVRAHGIVDAAQISDGFFADLWFSNGMVARFENTWAGSGFNGVWRWGQFDIEGTNGRADITPSEQGMMIHKRDGSVTSPDTVGRPELHGRITGSFAALVHHFLDAILGYADPIMTLEDGLRTVEAAAAMEKSMQENRVVQIDEL